MNLRSTLAPGLYGERRTGTTDRSGLRPRRGAFSLYDPCCWAVQAVLSVFGLVLLSPLFLLIGFLIKMTSPGPVFYRGPRVGQGQRVFNIYKFRTLVEGAEARIGARLLNQEDRQACSTPIGRFLKRTKLDELPQLFNVVKKEMRLVGPRPIRPVFLKKCRNEISNYEERFSVPPGITGIAQLRGGYYTSPRNKLRYDLIYIRSRSLLLDFKLILLTFVRILHRWLSMGFFILFLFLFVSFAPFGLQHALYVSLFGIKIGLVYILIITAAAWIFLKNDSVPFSLYRCPLNVPLVLFLVASLVSVLFSDDPYAALRGVGYYLVTGLLVAFLIVNSLARQGFIFWTVRTIALSSVVISLLGLFQVFVLNYTVAIASHSAPGEEILEGYTRIGSLLGSPAILAVYLVLGIPLLLSELARARTQFERDFWLVCTTISFTGIFFTQSRIGLLALLVTGAVFLYRYSNRLLSCFVIPLLCLLFLVSLGLPRFSLPRVRLEAAQWTEKKIAVLKQIPVKNWLVGTGAKTTPEVVQGRSRSAGVGGGGKEKVEIGNMHVTLMLEYGIVGWMIILWLIFSAVRAMTRAHDKAKSGELKCLLWAIVSAAIGFLVSMNGTNTFHNLALQVFFWSLIGIGLGIVVHLNGQKRQNLIWRFGDAGDG